MAVEQAARKAIDAAFAKRLVSEVIAQLPPEVPFDAQRVLAEHPGLKANRSAVLDIAYEEFCRRTAAGENVSADEFAQRFSGVERSLLDLLAVHRYLEETPSLFPQAADQDWPAPPDIFLGFELQQELGRGAFSRVYLAREPSLGNRTVVVKVCQRGGKEAQVLGRLEHPNIVPVHSVQQHERTGLFAICMPYLGTATLYDVLDAIAARGAVPADDLLLATVRSDAPPRPVGSYVDAVVRIGAELAEALQFAHARGICHGDVKPSNVLMTGRGAMLLDFNLAYWASGAEPNEIGGTLPYMAPEQLQAVAGLKGAPPDARTDIFSLGVLLYELLAGRLPFGRLSPDQSRKRAAADLLDLQCRGPYPLRQVNSRVDRHLARLVESCLAFDPNCRPQSAASLVGTLNSRIATTDPARRRMALCSIGAFLACSLAAGAALSIVRRDLPEPGITAQAPGLGELDSAAAALEQKDFRTGLALLNPILESDPQHREALFLRGRTHLGLGDHRAAGEDFRALLQQVEDARVLAALAHCESMRKKYSEAAAQYESVIEQGFASANVLNNLAHCRIMRGDLDEAESLLSAAQQLDGTPPAVHHNLALIYFRRAARTQGALSVQNARKALASIVQAAESGSDYPELWQDWAYILGLLADRTRERPPESESFATTAVEMSERAVAQGLDIARLQPVRQYLAHDARIRARLDSLSSPTEAPTSQPTALLIDPLIDFPAQSLPPFGALREAPME